jgi:hypothetical protein
MRGMGRWRVSKDNMIIASRSSRCRSSSSSGKSGSGRGWLRSCYNNNSSRRCCRRGKSKSSNKGRD